MPSKLERIPTVAALAIVAVVVAACVIRLRDNEGQVQSNASVGRPSDQLAEKLEHCRSVAYEQKNELGECQKIWAEKRHQFLGQRSGPPVRGDQSNASGLPSPAPGNDVGRVRSGGSTSARD